MKWMGYESAVEGLAEKFHVSSRLLAELNPGKNLEKVGEAIVVPAVERGPVRQSFRDVVFRDPVGSCQVGDRSCDLDHPVEPSSGERHVVDGSAQQSFSVRTEPGLAARDRPWQVSVAGYPERRVASPLPIARLDHPVADHRRRLACGCPEQLVLGETRDGEPQVDPVEQRP